MSDLGHSLGRSYSSTEVQSVYFTAPAYWAIIRNCIFHTSTIKIVCLNINKTVDTKIGQYFPNDLIVQLSCYFGSLFLIMNNPYLYVWIITCEFAWCLTDDHFLRTKLNRNSYIDQWIAAYPETLLWVHFYKIPGDQNILSFFFRHLWSLL